MSSVSTDNPPVPNSAPVRLGVNVDHVATVRNARGGRYPDPVRAAEMAIAAGADGITAHLREDRRHIRDDDIDRLRERLTKPLNLEMAATDEMVAIALRVKPHAACLVPERRQERTTEGGLDVVSGRAHLEPAVRRLVAAGIRVSLFIVADEAQIKTAAAVGAPVIELHTGAWCDALAAQERERAELEWTRIRDGVRYARTLGLEIHAGHGLDYVTAETIAAQPEIAELNIGHFIIADAIFDGLTAAVERMRQAIARGRGRIATP
jgi:pyridoxine 5-phosphate synthase